MKDIVKIVAFFIVIGGFLSLSVACEVAKWRECRRYHPVWYCWTTGGSK
jgi:hypothetical protein